MKKESKIYVAGHNGMVGSAIVRALKKEGFTNIVTRSSRDLNLISQQAVNDFFSQEQLEYVFLAAAKVGGIYANSSFPAEFIYNNLMIESNVIHAAYQWKVKKLLFLGSSCIYPKFSEQPIREEALLTGSLEPTNEAYAVAKIAGIELCKFYRQQYGCHFISAMPTNLYGPGDNYHLETSHVLPALLRKFHEAKQSHQKEVVIWGSGTPKREFLHVDDLAAAVLFLMEHYDEAMHINIGTGEDETIFELACRIQKIVGYQGNIVKDSSKPDGTPRKLLDVSRLHQLGFRHRIGLEEGIRLVYEEILHQGLFND